MSVKRELRSDSARLNEFEDKLTYVRLTRFLLALRRQARAREVDIDEELDARIVGITMDRYALNLVNLCIDDWVGKKKWAALEHATGLLVEMLHLLWYPSP